MSWRSGEAPASLGGLAYTAAALLTCTRPRELRLGDGTTLTPRRLTNLVINNTAHLANFRAFHDARLDDDRLDVLEASYGWGRQMLHNAAISRAAGVSVRAHCGRRAWWPSTTCAPRVSWWTGSCGGGLARDARMPAGCAQLARGGAMISALLAVTIPGFLLGSAGMALADRRVAPQVARQRWLKIGVFFAIVHGVWVSRPSARRRSGGCSLPSSAAASSSLPVRGSACRRRGRRAPGRLPGRSPLRPLPARCATTRRCCCGASSWSPAPMALRRCAASCSAAVRWHHA